MTSIPTVSVPSASPSPTVGAPPPAAALAATAAASIPAPPPAASLDDFPRRIILPSADECDAVSVAEWSQMAHAAGWEVIDSSKLAEGNVVLALLPNKFTSALLAKQLAAIEKLPAASRTIKLVTTAVLSRASPLGVFPHSLVSFARLMHGLFLCPTALNVANKKSAQAMCDAMGGFMEGTYRGRVTHLVAQKALSEKFRAALKYNRAIVTPEWLEACFRAGAIVPVDDFKVGCLAGATVSLAGFDAQSLAELTSLVKGHGGVVVAALDTNASAKGVTHVVAAWPVSPALSEITAAAKVPIVGRQWLDSTVANPAAAYREADFPVRSPAEEKALRAEADAAQRAIEEKAAAEAADAAAKAKAESDSVAERMRLQAERDEQDRIAAAEEQARIAAASAAAAAALQAQREADALAEAKAAAEAQLRRENEIEYDADNDSWLSGLSVMLLGLDGPAQQTQAQKIVRFGGGTRLTSIAGRSDTMDCAANANVSCVVLVTGSAATRASLEVLVKAECGRMKSLSSLQQSMAIVTFAWLMACHRAKTLLPFEGFALSAAPTVDASMTAGLTSPTAGFVRTPSLVRAPSVSRPGPFETNSARRPATPAEESKQQTPHAMDVTEHDVTVDAPTAAGGAAGPTNFAQFNSSLDKLHAEATSAVVRRSSSGRSKSALPPPAPEPSALVKMVAAAAANRESHIFASCRFVVEDEDADSEGKDAADDSQRLLPALRFTAQHRLTVMKQLKDFGASFVHDPGHLKGAQWKNQIDFVIGSVCGSIQRSNRSFVTAYGEKSLFASYQWVTACIKAKRLLPVPSLNDVAANLCWAGRIPRLLPSSPPIVGFSALRITSSGFSKDEGEVIGACVRQAGAQYTPGLSKVNTHVIFCEAVKTEPPQATANSKKEYAWKNGIPVVQMTWLLDCWSDRRLPDKESEYHIQPTKQEQAALASADAAQRATRTPVSVPDSPLALGTSVAPDTPMALGATTPVNTSPLALGKAVPRPRSTRRSRSNSGGDAEGKEGEIPSQLDEEEDDDDFGFGKGLKSALAQNTAVAAAQPAPAFSSPVVRPKRSRKSAADAAAASAASPVASVTTPVSTHADDASADAPPAGKGAKAAFQQLLKQSKQSSVTGKGKGKRSTTVSTIAEESEGASASEKATPAALDDSADDGEAEAYASGNKAASKKSSSAKATRSKSTSKRQAAVEEEEEEPAEEKAAEEQVPATPLKPFQRSKGKASAAAKDAPLSLATASAVVPPVLRVSPSPKKSFKKIPKKSAQDSTPPSTPLGSAPPSAAPPSSSLSALPHPNSRKSAALPDIELSTPAAVGKRVKRRIELHAEAEADESAAAADDSAIVVEDEEQPGSQSVEQSIRKKKRGASRRKKIVDDDEEDEAAEGEGEVAAAEEPAKPAEEAPVEVPAAVEPTPAKRSRSKKAEAVTPIPDTPAPEPTTTKSRSRKKAVAAEPAVEEEEKAAPEPVVEEAKPEVKAKPKRKTKQEIAEEKEAAAVAAKASESKQDEPAVTSPAPVKQLSKSAKAAAAAAEKTAATAAAAVKHSSPLKSPAPSVAAAATPASRSRAASSRQRGKDSTPLRSPSLGGGPESSVHAPPSRSRVVVKPKDTFDRLKMMSQNDDPYAFDEDDEADSAKKPAEATEAAEPAAAEPTEAETETKGKGKGGKKAATATQVTETQSLLDGADSAPAAAAPTVAAGRKRKAAPVTAEPAAEPDEDAEEADDDALKKPTPRTKKAAAAAVTAARKAAAAAAKQAESDAKAEEESAEADAEASAPPAKRSARAPSKKSSKSRAVEVTHDSITPTSSQLPPEDLIVPDSVVPPTPPAPRSAKRKAEETKPDEPKASPLKRSLSLKAVEMLSTLQTKEGEEKETEPEEETKESPKKKAKTSRAAAAKKSAKDAKDDAEMAAEPEKPAAAAKGKRKVPPKAEPEPEEEEPEAEVKPEPKRKASKKKKADDDDDEFVPEDVAEKQEKKKQKAAAAVVEEPKESSPEPAAKRSKKAAAAAAVVASSPPALVASKSPPRVFTLTGVHTADKAVLVEIIESLGGRVMADDALDYRKLTHIISETDGGPLKRSEKALMALLGKHFLLHPSFLAASKKAGKFVDEAPYEFVRHKSSQADPLLAAAKQWYQGARKPYAGWCVAYVFTDDVEQKLAEGKQRVFVRLLEHGGGEMLTGKDMSRATHVLVYTAATAELSSAKEIKAVQAVLAQVADASGVVVAKQEFLVEHMVQAGKVDASTFQLALPAGRAASTSKKAAASSQSKKADTASQGKSSQSKKAESSQGKRVAADDAEMEDAEEASKAKSKSRKR